MAKLNYFQQQVLIGLLLGNGSLQNVGKNYRFRFVQSEKRKDYLFNIYEILKYFVKTPPKLMVETRASKDQSEEIVYNRWYFNTLSSPCFSLYVQLFYRDGKKVITQEVLDLLDRQSLAYWFMDNGSIKSEKSKGFRLCTDIYNQDEILELQNLLKTKFSLETSLAKQRNSYRFLIKAESHNHFMELIDEYLMDSMLWKKVQEVK